MGFIAAAFVAVAGLVASAASVIVPIVISVVSTVGVALTAATAAMTLAVGTIVSTIAAVTSALATTIYAAVAATTLQLKTLALVIATGLKTYVGALASGFGSFLEAIHFKTLISIHEIAYILSEDYRNMMNRIYGQISKVSEALGFAPQFLNLAFRNTRNLVLSASSLLGRKYDIAEIGWLNSWNEYLKSFSQLATTFQNNPGDVFYTLDKWFTKGAVDTAAESMQIVYQTIENTLIAIKTTAEQIIVVRDDFGTLVEDLPEFIKKEITPYTEDILAKFDQFQADVYSPRMQVIDQIISDIGANLAAKKAEIDDLVEQLKRPGDIFDNLFLLSADERADQEEKIRRPVFRDYDSDVESFSSVYLPTNEGLQKLALALKYEGTPPEWRVPEVETPGRRPGVPIEPRTTWDVGDY